MTKAQEIRDNAKTTPEFDEKEINRLVYYRYENIVRWLSINKITCSKTEVPKQFAPKIINLFRREGFGVIVSDELKGKVIIDYIEEKIVSGKDNPSFLEIFVYV